MFGIPLAFTAPLALAALVGLPLLYYLLRVTPPRPRQVPFPPLRLFLDLIPVSQNSAAHAALAADPAPRHRRLHHSGDGGTGAQSGRARRRLGAAADRA